MSKKPKKSSGCGHTCCLARKPIRLPQQNQLTVTDNWSEPFPVMFAEIDTVENFLRPAVDNIILIGRLGRQSSKVDRK